MFLFLLVDKLSGERGLYLVNDLDVSDEIAESQNSASAQDVDVESCCQRRAEVETGSDVEDNGHLVSDQVAGLYTQL